MCKENIFFPHLWTVGPKLPMVENDEVCVPLWCPKDAQVIISAASTDF